MTLSNPSPVLVLAVSSIDIKKIKTSVDNLYVEKQKIEKEKLKKPKKGANKPKLRMEQNVSGEEEVEDQVDNEFPFLCRQSTKDSLGSTVAETTITMAWMTLCNVRVSLHSTADCPYFTSFFIFRSATIEPKIIQPPCISSAQ